VVVANVFVSHASEDRLLAAEIQGWLDEAGHEVFVDQDLRHGIALGEKWEERLYERLRWADAVVCLVTASYRDSAWCTAEVGIARSQGSQLLPLRAKPGVTHPLLTPSQYQYGDLEDRLKARTTLLEALSRLDVAGGWGWPDGRSPFPGLRPFDTDLHRVFFGRKNEVEEVAKRLRSPADFEAGGILLVIGPSGCGKSSLVRAGLLPRMALESGWHTLPAMVPGRHPMATLAREITRSARQLRLDWTLSFVGDRLSHDDGLAVLADELLLATLRPGHRVLLVVDQFEELLTLASAEERARFSDLLRPALAGSVRVVGTLRLEFLDQVLGGPELADLPTNTFALRPLRPDALVNVIEGPAELADIYIDPELVARLVADTGTPDAQPLLAFTLAQLAEGITRGGRLSMDRYDQLGGVQGALISQADAALADAVAINDRTPDQVIAGLLGLVTVDDHGRPVRRLVDRDELPAEVQAQLAAFTARRLLTTDTDSGRVVIGVTHEAFFSAWPPLAAAISAEATGLRARRALEQAAEEWEDAGLPSSRLLGHGQLAAAIRDTGAKVGRKRPANSNPPVERQPLLSSAAPVRRYSDRVVTPDPVKLSARARDFLYRSNRRDRVRRWGAVAVLSTLLVLAIIAAAVALAQQRYAEAQGRFAQGQLRVATARQLMTAAGVAIDDDPLDALQLGIAAESIDDGPETRASLVTSLISTHYTGTLRGHNDVVGTLAFSPDGRVMVSGAEDESWRAWDFKIPNHPQPLGPPVKEHADVNAVAISQDGKILATGMADKTVRLWSLADPSRPVPLGPSFEADTIELRTLAFADPKTLVTVGEDGMVRVWDVTNGMHPTLLGAPLESHHGIIRTLAINPRGHMFATGGDDGRVRLWSLANRHRPAPLGPPVVAHHRWVRSLAFSPDGLRLVTGSDDRTARAWNATDPGHLTPLGPPLIGHQDLVIAVAFDPTNPNEVVTGSADQTVLRWSLADPAHPRIIGKPLTGAHDDIFSLAYVPDGSMLAAGIRDGTIVIWNLAGGLLPAPLGPPLVGHKAGIDPVLFSPAGDVVATASEDGTVKFWQLAPNPARPALIASVHHSDEVAAAAFSRDNPEIFATGSGNTVNLWNVKYLAHPERLGAPLIGHEEAVVSLAFCPGRDMLVSGDEGGFIRFWSVKDPTHPIPLGKPLYGNDEVDSLACSPDGLLAVAGVGAVRLWSIASQGPVSVGKLAAGNKQAVNSVAFSPDGEILAAAADDGFVTLWDIRNHDDLIRLGAPLRAHGDPVTSIAFSPQKDEPIMVTASDDKTLQLWDLTDKARPIRLGAPLEGHHAAVNSVAIGPNGIMASGSDDNTARLWDLSELDVMRRDPVAYACSVTGQGFNRDEWSAQITALSYQKTC
jgi:WD40 repeat protein